MAYSAIKPSGGDTGAPRNLLKRLAIIQHHIDVKGKKVIDCGCGTGQYVMGLLNAGADASGIEYESEKVARFKENHPQLADRVNVGDIEQTNLPGDYFDAALLNEVLEHVPDENRALTEIHRILKPAGALIIFSPNRFFPFETHLVSSKRSGKRLPIYTPFVPYIPLNIGERVFTYPARNYWPHQLRQMVRHNGFNIIETGYVWQTFENISGKQTSILSKLSPVLRQVFAICERLPVLQIFGVSQLIVATKG